MSNPDDAVSSSRQMDAAPAIRRLLFVSDAAVADADLLPPAVRAIIDAAAELYVLTPTLPGRLAWLADDVDRFRHYADERLDAVLSHMHAIDADADGEAARGSVMTVVADAVTEFEPDHILIALHVSDHANWQERRLIEQVEHRFRLPVTTFAVDLAGHTPTADGPLLLCYDGSEDAKHAIEHAGRLLGGRDALVVTVWQGTPALGSLAFAGATDSMFNFAKVNRAAAERGGRVAADGVRIAEQAGLHAEPVAVEATGPVWRAIVEIADRHDAATIVMGCRGLTGLRSMLLGSVSSTIVHHADRPTLVIPKPARLPAAPAHAVPATTNEDTMAIAQREAEVVWEGNLARGAGALSSGSGALELPVTWASRTEQPGGNTSPEELIAAAHASCFAMALALVLGENHTPPEQMAVTAACTLDEVDGAPRITTAALTVRARVPGLDRAGLRRNVEQAAELCPVSNALRGNVEISVRDELDEAD
jgi:osmotically inducible protein OsmC